MTSSIVNFVAPSCVLVKNKGSDAEDSRTCARHLFSVMFRFNGLILHLQCLQSGHIAKKEAVSSGSIIFMLCGLIKDYLIICATNLIAWYRRIF